MIWIDGGWVYRKTITVSLTGGNDTNTVSLLHMNGADGFTQFKDSAVGGTHVWTPTGTAQMDTAQLKFGGASGLFDGDSDSLSTPDSSDFDLGAGDFTIDFWMRMVRENSGHHTIAFYGIEIDSDLFQWYLEVDETVGDNRWKLQAVVQDEFGAVNVIMSDTALADQTWYHVAFVRNGGDLNLYIDGAVQVSTYNIGTDSLIGDLVGTLYCKIGDATLDGGNTYYNGHIDEFRISKGIARWTEDFTPPTREYSVATLTNYQMKLLVGESSGASGEEVDCGGKCLSNFNDIRFSDASGNLLDYWIESITGTTPNQLATIWIEFDSLATGATTFYMFYGNPNATSYSNGANTFILFDDFERGSNGDSVGGNWTVAQGSAVISTEQFYGGSRSCKLVGAANALLMSISQASSNNISVQWRCFKEDSARVGAWANSSTWCYVDCRALDEGIFIYAGYSVYVDTGAIIIADTWQVLELNDFNWTTKRVDLFLEGDKIADGFNIGTQPATGFENSIGYQGVNSSGDDSYIDNLLVRNWRDVEPYWGTWGSEVRFSAKMPVFRP